MKHEILDALRKLAVSNIHLYHFVRTKIAVRNFMLPHDEDFFGLASFGDGEALFLDIGANDGLSALSYRKLIKNRPILSIEPNILHEPALKHAERRIPKFSYKIMAASDTSETLTLSTPVYKGVSLTNYASTSQEAARKNLQTHMRIRDIGAKAQFETTTVTAQTIDSLNLSPAIIKIDVEGHEAAVIAGMQETINRSRPVFMIEYNVKSYEAVAAQLVSLGYSAAQYSHIESEFEPINISAPPLNVFFLPPNPAFIATSN